MMRGRAGRTKGAGHHGGHEAERLFVSLGSHESRGRMSQHAADALRGRESRP